MKIISKFKDFYDFKVAKYGVDPILVFDRRAREDLPAPKALPAPLPEWEKELDACVVVSWLYVGNFQVALFNSGKRVYSAADIESVRIENRNGWMDKFLRFCDGQEYCLIGYNIWEHRSEAVRQALMPKEIRRDDDARLRPYHDIPLLLAYFIHDEKIGNVGSKTAYAANPQLSALGVYLDPDFVWQRIVEYLSQLKSEAETSPPVPDQAKIGNKGFDEKHSFRPKMKRRPRLRGDDVSERNKK